MTLDRRDDGTVAITLAGKETRDPAGAVTAKAADLEVVLRRPTLEELLDLWQAMDDKDRAQREPDGSVRTVVACNANADWIRDAVVTLGPPGVYGPYTGTKPKTKAKVTTVGESIKTKADPEPDPTTNGAGGSQAPFRRRWALVRDDLTEPAWFVSGTIETLMLGHWQNTPLDLGESPTTT